MKQPPKSDSTKSASKKPARQNKKTDAESAVSRAREAFKSDEHKLAIEIIEGAHAHFPDDIEIAAEYGLMLCYLQREDEAVELFETCKQAKRFDELGKILSRYTYCRTLMAKRLGVQDSKGRSLRERVKKVIPADPTDCGIKLSACLIVKNEEKHLERCLKSIVNNVDEIIVVDTGSTDSTIEIARAFGAKIGFFKWCDDFAAARNESLRLATGNWALWIDADEEIDPKSWHAIAEGLIRPQFGGYYTRIVNMMDDEGRQQYVHSPVRIFQRLPEVQFEGRVHEQVLQCFDKLELPSASLDNVTFYHYGYRPEDMQEKSKTDRTIRMLEREVLDSPEDAFHWFNLANAYSVARRPNDAAHAAKMCIQHIHPKNSFGSLAFQILSSALSSTNRSEEALDACEQAREKGFFTILNQFEKAMALMRLGRDEEALASIDECLDMEWPASMTGDYGIFRHKRHAVKGHILSELARAEEALEWLDFSLSIDPHFSPANFAKGLALEKLARLDEALAFLRAAMPDPDYAQQAMKAAGRVCRSLGKNSEAAEYFRAAWLKGIEDVECWVAWVQILERNGSPSDMIGAYEAYSKVAEPNSDVMVNWGRALVQSGDTEKALCCFTEAIQRDPTNPNAFFNAGDLLYKLGAFTDAAQVYEAGLRLQPANAEGWFVLGNAMAQIGILDGARTAYVQALAIQPDHASAQFNLSLVSGADEAAA